MVTEISRQICQKEEIWHSKWPPGGHLGSDQPNFFGTDGPYGANPHTKFGLPTLSHYENFPKRLFRLRQTDDGRTTDAK